MPKINFGAVATTALAVTLGLYLYDIAKSKLPTL